jgi:hypothetical protein
MVRIKRRLRELLITKERRDISKKEIWGYYGTKGERNLLCTRI